MKLEDVLKQQGYTDADLESISTLLKDSRFRASMEAGMSNLELERDAFKSEAEKWERWRTEEAIPKIDTFAKKETEARTEAAALREQIKIAKEYGYLPKDQAEDPQVVAAREAAARAQGQPPAGQPMDLKNYVTRDDIGHFANLEGEAIAMAADLAEEYRVLNPGHSLVEYVGADGSRGMRALRKEAVAAKVPLDQYVATKFSFAAKREEAAAAQRKAAEDAIRADERSKVAAELGNPMLRSPMPSRNPIIPARTKDSGMPWEKTPNELKERRLAHAWENQQKVQ